MDGRNKQGEVLYEKKTKKDLQKDDENEGGTSDSEYDNDEMESRLCENVHPGDKYKAEIGYNANTRYDDTCGLKKRLQESLHSPSKLGKVYNKNAHITVKDDNKMSIWIPLIIIIIVGILVVLYLRFSETEFDTNPVNYNEDLRRDFKLFMKNFPQKDNQETMYTILSEIDDLVSKRKGIKVFLMLHNSLENEECFLKHLANMTMSHLGLFGSEPVWLSGSGLESKLREPSRLNDYRNEIQQKFVVVVTELEKIPGKIARYFHSFCDSYNPAVDPAVYFFLLQEAGWNFWKYDKLAERAQVLLKNLWHELPDNILEPLIVRMSENVLKIQTESSVPCDITFKY